MCAGAHMAILPPSRRSRVQRARAGRSEAREWEAIHQEWKLLRLPEIPGESREEDPEGNRCSRRGRGARMEFLGQCADRVHATRSTERRHQGGQRRLPAPEPAGADGQQLPGQLPVPGAVPRGFQQRGALPFTCRQSLRQRAQQLRLRHRRNQPALGGQLGRLRRPLPLSLQGPRPAGHPGPCGEPAPHPDPEVRLGGAQSSRLHAGYGQVSGRRLLRDRPARGQWISGARLGRALPQSSRRAPRAERHAVDRPGLQHQRRLRLSC